MSSLIEISLFIRKLLKWALPEKIRSWGGWRMNCPGVLKKYQKIAMSRG